ncbi:hypothetical protein SteCoe_18810 [Stentor coeruleus]|uniref:Uncharacterized protein n=1 Tax=Stentor coeruleus TaxID=5963 RepID=A0A1R2BVK9_9CILI|nr:hypothetical protein SteCoe_18810 [Stentor coeruleus]
MLYKRTLSQKRFNNPSSLSPHQVLQNEYFHNPQYMSTKNLNRDISLPNDKFLPSEALDLPPQIKPKQSTQNEILNKKALIKKASLFPSPERFSRAENFSVKKVRFSPDIDVRSSHKLTASSFVDQVRQENSELPDIFHKKKLYHKLDQHFGFEGTNDYFIKFFVTPNSKLMIKKKFNPLAKRSSRNRFFVNRDKPVRQEI